MSKVTTPVDIINEFFKTYTNDHKVPESVEKTLSELVSTQNPAKINELYSIVHKFQESAEFKENYQDSKRFFIRISNRKSANEPKSIYMDYHLGSSKAKLAINATNVMFKSGVKMPYEYKDGIPKYQTITFAKADRNEIEGGDYVPKKVDTPEQQTIENKKMKEKLDKIEVGTALFALALDLCAIEIEKTDRNMIEKFGKDDKTASGLIRQASKRFNGQMRFFGFQQKKLENKETDEEIPLKYPINRIRIPIDKNTGKLGYQTKTEFVYPISDAKKMARQKSFNTPIPACVKVNGKSTELHYSNSKSFLTYKSLSNLIIQFEGCLSSFGKSATPKIYKAFVSTHRTKVDEVPFRAEDMSILDNGNDDSDVEASDVEEVQKPKQKGKSAKKSKSSDSDDSDVNSDSDVDSDAESEPEKKSKGKPDSKKKVESSDDDDETDLFNDSDVKKETPVLEPLPTIEIASKDAKSVEAPIAKKAVRKPKVTK